MKKDKNFIISIDQGTTSSRAILFNLRGQPVYSSQREFTQYFPKSGWVEHDPEEIWSTTKKTLSDVIKKNKQIKGKILTIGITNQRETTVLWDKKQARLFIMQSFGRTVGKKNSVKNLESKIRKLLSLIELVF